MIYKLMTVEEEGATYVSGWRLISEHGIPSHPNEVAVPPAEELLDGNGKRRLILENGEVLVRAQALSAEEASQRGQDARRAVVQEHLIDLMLAAAEGKDIGAEVRTLLVGGKE